VLLRLAARRIDVHELPESAGQISPMTWGFRRPIIMLPHGWRDWPRQQLHSALLHEIAHVERGDWLVHLGGHIVRALYWPNPLVWAAARKLRHESEKACDDTVLDSGVKAGDYAAHLLAIARVCGAGSRESTLSLAMARIAGIERRIRSILHPARAGRASRASVFAPILAWCLLATPIAALQILGAEPALTQQRLAQPAASAPRVTAPEERPGSSLATSALVPSPLSDSRLAVPADHAVEQARTADLQAASMPLASATAWGPPVNGLQAGIRLITDPGEVRMGKPVRFAVVLRAIGGHGIDLAFANAQSFFGWRTKRQADLVVIAPRWRYAEEEHLEKLVPGATTLPMGASTLRVEPNQEIEVPMKRPEFLVGTSAGKDPKQPVIVAKPGARIRVQGQPLAVIARGEEWVEELETGILTVAVANTPGTPRTEPPAAAAGSPSIAWGPEVRGVQAGIRLERPAAKYSVGEPIWQEVYVRNRGTEPVSFTEPAGFEEQGRAEVNGIDGGSVHVKQYYGVGGFALRNPQIVRPGEIVMVGRHSLAFTGALFDPASETEPAPGISFAAEGLPKACAPPGRYLIRQLPSGTMDSNPVTLQTGAVEVEISPAPGEAGNAVAAPRESGNAIRDIRDVTVAWGKPAGGLQIGLLFVDGKNHFVAGEKVRVAIAVRCVGASPISFWHDTSFADAALPVVRDAGRPVRVRAAPEPEWRPLGDLRLTGVTYDMTFAPSAGGPSRTRVSEIKPGQTVIGYFLGAFIAPQPRGSSLRRYAVEQPWSVGVGAQGALDTRLTTGQLSMEVMADDQAGEH
jgi:hypothetical protein